ncbi:zinc metalloprotease [Sphaerisporangium krabiense]|nr:zinc metalloprotease [Sphaerisporangium krabiense]
MKPPPGAAARPLSADPLDLATRAADQAVAGQLDDLRKGADEVWHRTRIIPGAGGLYYAAYDRTYKGLPVIGGAAVVVVDSAGRVRETIATSGPTTGVPTTATVPARDALATARTRLDRVDDTAAPHLVVLAHASKARLAWEATVAGIAGGRPSIQHVYVDARTREIAGSYDAVRAGTGNGYYNGQVTIQTAGSGSSYSMTDTTRPGIRCGGQTGAAYTGTDDIWGNGLGTNLETACVDVLYGVQRMWDMLRDWLGFNGINGSGGGYPARVGLNDVNAYWNGSYVNFGHTQDNQRQVTSMDFVAHEYSHVITGYYPPNPYPEAEALDEGAGDIFGALTEHYANNPADPPDYLVGEETNLVGQGPVRYMYDPSRAGNLNCYATGVYDLYKLAGPLTHWFYLLAEGSTPGGGKPSSPTCPRGPSWVTGIGIQKAGKIFMGALQRRPANWTYAIARVASLSSAIALYGANSQECVSTRDAWNAVGVPVQSEPQCTFIAPDFSLWATPNSGYIPPGGSVSTMVATRTIVGAPQTVALTASGLPSGATATFTPASVTSGGSVSLTITTSASTPEGSYTVVIKGTGSTAAHTAVYTLRVATAVEQRTFRNDADYPIPDNATITSPVTSTATGNAVSPVQVDVTIDHPCAEDLQIRLRGPDGVYYTLATSGTSTCTSFGTRRYTAPVTQQAAGTWVLEVTDNYRKDTGRLDAWSVIV